MRKLITALLAAGTMAGAIFGAAAPASAQMRGGWHGGGWHGGGYYGGWHGGGSNWGLPLAAGIAGLAVGAAIAHPYYSSGYYGYAYPAYGYAYPAYGYGYGPAYCQGGRWVWDPYYRRNVWVTQAYPC
jgi:hypothetical protein